MPRVPRWHHGEVEINAIHDLHYLHKQASEGYTSEVQSYTGERMATPLTNESLATS